MLHVAKWSATYGEYVQSSTRVGRPWCWASAIQFHTESAGMRCPAAYLRKLRRRCRSSVADSAPPCRRRPGARPEPTSPQPRNAWSERCTASSSFHDPENSSSCKSPQVAGRTSSPIVAVGPATLIFPSSSELSGGLSLLERRRCSASAFDRRPQRLRNVASHAWSTHAHSPGRFRL